MLERVKRECAEVIGNLRKATKRKNEDTKKQVRRAKRIAKRVRMRDREE